ncbi:DnaD domain protein [Levilactobacillus brevis]|nr:DnaD domain protein [Levilactobacillus brevis]
MGEDLYQSLVSVNTSTTERSTDEENITKNFLEVFHVDGQELAELPTAITAGRQHLDAETHATAPALQATPADFDFKLLGEILEHSFIDTRALRSERQLLLTEHATYGLDEVTMARYIGEATDLATNQFNAETFKRVIAQNFGRPQSAKPVAQPQKTATTPTNQSVNSAEQALIKVAANTAPAVFLQAIKQKSGGFVTDGEQRIVRDLVSRQLFPEAVLNLMVYHVLVDEDRPTLNKNLLDTIANDWSKAKITTPEQAIQKIRERQQALSDLAGHEPGNQRRSRRRYQSGQRHRQPISRPHGRSCQQKNKNNYKTELLNCKIGRQQERRTNRWKI